MLGKIAGRRTHVLIDSGASLTLINQHLFSQLPKYYYERALPPPTYLSLQLADRSQIQVKYALSVPITIANSTRRHSVYVVPQLWRSCIIGNDLIRKHNLQIDGGRQYAYFKEKEENKPYLYDEEKEPENNEQYTLVATERVKLAPFHAFNIQVRPTQPFSISDEDNDQNEYEITSFKATPCVANGIILPRQQITLQVANLTETTITIHVNQPLATMTRPNQIQLNMIQHGNVSSTAKQLSTSSVEEPSLNNTNVNEYQKEQIRQLIREFPNVFRTQPGRTTKLKHQINLIPGSQPCNSPPFRYAPARRQVIEEKDKGV